MLLESFWICQKTKSASLLFSNKCDGFESRNVVEVDGGSADPLKQAFVQWWFRVAVTPLMHRDERVNHLHGDVLSGM